MNHTKHFINSISTVDSYKEALDIVKKLSNGGIWLIGGMVYRGIASKAYGINPPDVDFDFIVQDIEPQELPAGWSSSVNTFNNMKLKKGSIEIDFIPLTNIHYIKENNLQPSIENYLIGVPLTVQSIAYDVRNKKIIGEVGKMSLDTQTVGINNVQQGRIYEKKYGVSIEDYAKEKADSLGFKVIL